MTTAGDGGAASGSIQVLARAAEILRAVAGEPGGLSQAEMADRLGLAKTTVHRIVSTLEAEGLLRQSTGGSRYRPGPEISRMAAAIQRASLATLREGLASLSRELGETVDLSILEGNNVRFLDQVIAPNRLQAVSAVGEVFPLHACAPGKAILATLVDRGRADLLPHRLASLTRHTLTTAADLRADLATVRSTGVAFDREEHTDGICAVAAVLDPEMDSPMAISVPLPSQRFYGREDELRVAVLAARDELRQHMEDDGV